MEKILFVILLLSIFVCRTNAQSSTEDSTIVFFKKMIEDNQAKIPGWRVNPNIDKHRMISLQSMSDSTQVLLIWPKKINQPLNKDFLWFVWLEQGVITFDSDLQVVTLFMTTPQKDFALYVDHSHRAAKNLQKNYEQHAASKGKVLHKYGFRKEQTKILHHLDLDVEEKEKKNKQKKK